MLSCECPGFDCPWGHASGSRYLLMPLGRLGKRVLGDGGATIGHGLFETDSSFRVKEHTAGKV